MNDLDQAVSEALKVYPQGAVKPGQADPFTDLDSAVDFALKTSTPYTKKINKFQQFLQQGAALADVTVGGIIPGIAGPLTYAATRPFTTAEGAKKAEEAVLGVTAQPFGKALGITESPYYKGEALNQAMTFVAENASKGADWISKQTGMPKTDVENMMQSLGLGVGIKAGPAVGRAAKKGIEKVEGVVEAGVAKAAPVVSEAARKLEPYTPFEITEAAKMFGKKPPAQQQAMGSVGAAGAEPAAIRQATIESSLTDASPELNQFILSQDPNNVNVGALTVKALEEKHGVRLTTGQRSGNTGQYSKEWNNRGGEGNPLGERFGSQPAELARAVDNSRIRNAPEINDVDPSSLGQLQINGLAAKDQMRLSAIDQAYKDLTNANGGQFPIDITKLNENIVKSLDKELKTSHLSSAIRSDLDQFYKNPTFEAYEALRTNLANEMRSSSDGNARAAAFLVRQELENLPIFGEGSGSPKAIELKNLADIARSRVRERAEVIKNNPAYRAAVKEFSDLKEASSQGESLNAAKFHDKYVAKATPEGVRRLKSELLPDDIANQAIVAAEFERVKSALVNASESNVKTEFFASFMKNNAKLLQETMGPQAFKDVLEIGLLRSHIAKPQAGTFNYSNSYSALLSDLAKTGLSQGLEAKLAMETGGASIPAVSWAKTLKEKMSKDALAAEALDPYGGLVTQKVSKRQQEKNKYKAARATYQTEPEIKLKDIGKEK